ncbi:Asp23/Gls24 family envelope stress response protein [Streptomyces sp. MK37H]|uniref:Asp23/Gls24 family envelope stress response protein n=1 Tax=Streptomyces sp. MK37H TaxID=2699117 RepID=UPI001B37C044|nr:Asp23/Gls24 family envelope stress response protein [Streptomyces sp. MK37H]
MSTQPPSRPHRGGPGSEGTGTSALPSPALRGATLIPDTVVARIAVRAAYEALTRQGGEPPVRFGLGTPRTTATVHDGSVRLGVSLELPYPVDIARAGGEIRHYMAERVSHLTGLRVDGITVSVQRLVAGRSLRRGRVE